VLPGLPCNSLANENAFSTGISLIYLTACRSSQRTRPHRGRCRASGLLLAHSGEPQAVGLCKRGLGEWPWLGWSGEHLLDDQQSQCWPGARSSNLASALASASRRGMLVRGFVPSASHVPRAWIQLRVERAPRPSSGAAPSTPGSRHRQGSRSCGPQPRGSYHLQLLLRQCLALALELTALHQLLLGWGRSSS
jgi:hypothetical protein